MADAPTFADFVFISPSTQLEMAPNPHGLRKPHVTIGRRLPQQPGRCRLRAGGLHAHPDYVVVRNRPLGGGRLSCGPERSQINSPPLDTHSGATSWRMTTMASLGREKASDARLVKSLCQPAFLV